MAETKAQEAEPSFPLEYDGNFRIDKSFQQPTKYRVYYWTTRPDADNHGPEDQEHWHPDSEHDSLEEAERRVTELQGGGKQKSLYAGPVTATKH